MRHFLKGGHVLIGAGIQMPQSTKLALVVEGDDHSRRALRKLLLTKGFRVVSAANKEQALRYVNVAPALMIIDLILPDGNGGEIIQKVRESGCNPMVAVISSGPGEEFADAEELRPDVNFGRADIDTFRAWLEERGEG